MNKKSVLQQSLYCIMDIVSEEFATQGVGVNAISSVEGKASPEQVQIVYKTKVVHETDS